MSVNITPGPVNRQDQLPLVLEALAGTWGEDGGKILLGRAQIEFLGKTDRLENSSSQVAIAILNGGRVLQVPPGGISATVEFGIIIVKGA